jgi:hypothetical protein
MVSVIRPSHKRPNSRRFPQCTRTHKCPQQIVAVFGHCWTISHARLFLSDIGLHHQMLTSIFTQIQRSRIAFPNPMCGR